MRQRNRAKNQTVLGGSIIFKDGVTPPAVSTYQYQSKTCMDYVEKKRRYQSRGRGLKPIYLGLPPSDCEIRTVQRFPGEINLDAYSWTFKNRVIDSANYNPSTDYYDSRDSWWRGENNRVYAIQTLAATHPFRPEFSIPVSLAELLDIGELLKITANSFASLVGGAYLQYRFGIVQFVKDIKTLHSITTSIERRMKEFNSLGLNGGLRRKVQLQTIERHYTGNRWYAQSTWGVQIPHSWTWDGTLTFYGTVRWRWKNGAAIQLNKLEAFNEAVKACFDLGELDAHTIWNSIPWTWLLDYFFSISDWYLANQNSSWVEPYDLCIVRKFHTTETWYPSDGWAAACSKSKFLQDIYARDVITAIPSYPPVRFGFLTKTQAITIAAVLGRFH